jgi:hypothetical protein
MPLPVRRKLLDRARGEDVTARITVGFNSVLVDAGRDRTAGMLARASSTFKRIVSIEGGFPMEFILAWSSLICEISMSIPLAALNEPLKNLATSLLCSIRLGLLNMSEITSYAARPSPRCGRIMSLMGLSTVLKMRKWILLAALLARLASEI